jgi:glucose/arabinose dehydrogenase
VKKCSQVYIRGQGGLLDIVLHPDYAKMVGFTSPMRHGRRRRRWKYKLIRAKLENESLCPNRITIQMEEIQRDSIWFQNCFDNEGYLYSQQENVAQSLSIHKTSLVTTGKFTASMDGRIPADNPGKTGARSHLLHRNPQGLAKTHRSYLGSRARTERRRRNQHHKRC